MTIQQIYDLAIEMGIKADPRGETAVKKLLAKTKKEYEELSEKKKKYFDKETLHNPYSDTRVFVGDPKQQVKKILAGIDADAAEVLLADRLNQKGAGIDLVIGHHPMGITLAALHDVMDLQIDAYAQVGVPVNVMDALMRARQEDIKRRIHPSNHNQVIDTARLLEVPLMNLHTTWDNMGDKFIKDYLANKTFDTVGELYDSLMEIPEYQEAAKGKNAPEIISGSPRSRAGKIAVFFTGGTNPSKEIYMELAKAGIGTLVDMHLTEDALKELKRLHMNVINAGHMASDSIGANLFFDVLESKGVEIIPCSGLIRVKRNSKKVNQ
jgi:putative NIF3 family GTP cyclohydrolase 1 type 2